MKPICLIALLLGAFLPASCLRAGVYPNDPARLWPGGIIPFQYASNPAITANQRCVLQAAMGAWAAVANVTFVPRTTQADYLLVQQGTVGPSYPPPEGYRVGSGAHVLNLNYWGTNNNSCASCTAVFGLAHEVGHALGLLHTHQSPNRNSFFNVRTNLVQVGFAGNYAIDPNSLAWPRGIPDIDSIMSYPLCTFSICTNSGACAADLANCAPILLREPYATIWAGQLTCAGGQCPPPVNCVGQRNHLSTWDQAVMSYLYPQSNWRFAEAGSTQTTADGTFHYPAKSFTNGVTRVPAGGTLFVEPSTYAQSAGTYRKAMTLRSTRAGNVNLRQ